MLPVLLLGLTLASPAQVRDEDQCSRAHPKITSPVEMTTCTSDIDGSERELKEAYDALFQAMDAGKQKSLNDVQQSWLAFRKAQCELDAGGFPGNTAHSSDLIACTAEMNRARARELELATLQSVGFSLHSEFAGHVVVEVENPADVGRQRRKFANDLRRFGLAGRLRSCTSMVDVTMGRKNSNHSYGAICELADGARNRYVLICNDKIVGHLAVKVATFVHSRDEVARFTFRNCTGG